MPANPLTTQFTVRNVPLPVSHYLRRRATATGKSVNQVIVEELEKATKKSPSLSAADALKDFAGGLDVDTIRSLEQNDREEKLWLKTEETKLRAEIGT